VPLRRPGPYARIGVNSDPTLETDTMAHNPVNHPLRPLYRALSALAGAYLVLFGVIGVIVNAGDALFATTGERVLGQNANLLWSLVTLVAGAIVLIVTAIGRNLDTETDKYFGWALLVLGSYGLATGRTDANYLGVSIATVVVTYLVGLALITSSLYLKTAPTAETGAPRQVREGRVKETIS